MFCTFLKYDTECRSYSDDVVSMETQNYFYRVQYLFIEQNNQREKRCLQEVRKMNVSQTYLGSILLETSLYTAR